MKWSGLGRWAGALLVALVWLVPATALSHPLGNFTTNQYVGIHVEPDGIVIDYVLDLAEIPASQQQRQIDTDGDGIFSEPEEKAFVESACSEARDSVTVSVDDRVVDPTLIDTALAFPPGEAGLVTLRLECRFGVDTPIEAGTELEVSNDNYAERLGWREMVLTTSGVAADTGLPSVSLTSRLQEYPAERVSSPVDDRTGTAVLDPVAGQNVGTPPPPVGFEGEEQTTPVDALGSLIDPEGGSPALPLAMVAALGLGIVHALAPGHGKTVMAAYLVGSRGTWRQAALLGGAVAVSHTVGVLALGVVTLIGTSAFTPEQAFPVLSRISGAIVTLIGVWMLFRWWRHRRAHRHDHPHHHHDDGAVHSHGGITHSHAVPDSLQGASGWKVLATMGLAGGLVPSASAVVLLLGAVSLGRVPFGILLIALFGLGMAATLVGVGFALVKMSRFSLDRFGTLTWMNTARRILTPVAATVVIVVGLFLTIQATS